MVYNEISRKCYRGVGCYYFTGHAIALLLGESAMFCPECGTENPDGARFCGNCRHQLISASGGSADNQHSPVVEIGSEPKAVSDGMKYGILAGSLVIPFIGMIMGLIYLVQGESEEKKDVGKLWLFGSIGIIVFYMIFSV
ncbi:MAG: zinc ribbon domain-containing protein [Candidatus Thiodiazotropha sp.]